MTMKVAGRCAAAVLAAVFWASPASPQSAKNIDDLTQAEQDEMYCVYNTLGDGEGSTLVAESYVFTDQSDEDAGKAKAALDGAVSTCASKYNWKENARSIAADIGTYGSAVDYLTQDLWFDGVEDAEIDKIFAIVNTLSDSEVDAFFDGSWMKNDAMKARVTGQLKAAGLPDDEYALETGQYLLEASMLAGDAIFTWIDTIAK